MLEVGLGWDLGVVGYNDCVLWIIGVGGVGDKCVVVNNEV